MTFHVLTLFPNMFDAPFNQSIIGRGQTAGHIQIHTHQIRDFTKNRQKQVDDYPYGGGGGLIMTAQPLHDTWKHAKAQAPNAHTIYFSPKGRTFTQNDAKRLVSHTDGLILVCGHYEGVDQRFIDHCVDEEISLGDFVLTGGEIPAIAVIDAVARLVPGVLSSDASFTQESHWQNTLEHPHYTRPPVWEGREVPKVLQDGVHIDIAHWRQKMSFLETIKRRPDMFSKLLFSKEDLKLLGALRTETDDLEIQAVLEHLHTERITVRPLTEMDAKRIANDAESYLKELADKQIHAFAVYAEGLGFCGHISYQMTDTKTAQLAFYMKNHALGRGIDVFATAYVLDTLFADENILQCIAPAGVSDDIINRCGFSAHAQKLTIEREHWIQNRGSK